MCGSKTILTLPDRLIIGYANWAQCDDKIITAVEQGVNVIIWFSINLSKDDNNNQIINGAIPNLDCVARIVTTLRQRNFNIINLISIGGWNSPLPDTSFTSEQWFQYLHDWNKNTVARPSIGWYGFDGFDWDPEGNDDIKNPANHFTISHLDLIGKISVLAKQAGYIVSLAPAQSYLDMNSTQFDLRVDHPPGYWQPDFTYHGRNLYAYWLVEYAHTTLNSGTTVPTFDWIGLQLYEGWSLANFRITSQNVSVKHYLKDLIQKMHQGWTVQFDQVADLNLKEQIVRVPPSRLIIGLANGWTQPYPPSQKFLLLQPQQLKEAFQDLPKDLKPRGFMFWNIADEGNEIDSEKMYMAKGLNHFLHIRDS